MSLVSRIVTSSIFIDKGQLCHTVTLNKFSGDTYLREYLPQKILTKPPGREGGEGARIRNDSQVGKNGSAIGHVLKWEKTASQLARV